MEPRLGSAVLVDALRRRVEAQGGTGMVLAKGDPLAGAVLVVVTERGAVASILERVLAADGGYGWRSVHDSAAQSVFEPEKFLERRRRFDPDLWVLELDVPAAQRFVAELNSVD